MDRKEEEKLKLLYELIKASRRSDRELSKALRTSQPTVTRRRTLLEKEKYVKEYTVVPDLRKMGYEIVAFTFVSFSEALSASKPQLLQKAREWNNNQPCVLFSADGEGIRMNSVLVSVHKDYSDFSRMISELRQDWQQTLKDIQSFIVTVNRPEQMLKPFSFKYIKECQSDE